MLPIGAALVPGPIGGAPVLIRGWFHLSSWRHFQCLSDIHLARIHSPSRSTSGGIDLGRVFRRVPSTRSSRHPLPTRTALSWAAIEVGLPGFWLWCFFWLWLRDATDAVLSQQGNRNRRWARIGVLAACLAGVAGHMVHGLIDYTWYNPRVASVFWAIVGIGAGMASSILRKVNPVQTTDVDALRAGEDNLENVVGNPLDAAAGTLERTLENQGISGESGSS